MGKRSKIWTYFDESTDDNVKCKIAGCHDPKVKHATSSTSNLWDHLHVHHSAVYDILKEDKLPNKRTSNLNGDQSASNSTPTKKKRTEDSEDSVLKMMARRNVPFTLADDKLFQKMFQRAFPTSELRSSRYYARKVLPRVANEIILKLKRDVGDKLFSITTDGWSSLNKPSPSLYSLTVHYLSEDFAPKKALFGVTQIDTSADAVNIKKAVLDYIEFVGLDVNKLVCIVRDDAANVKKASTLIGKPSFQCAAHCLHLIVTKFINSSTIKASIEKGQEWARLLHKSGPAMKLYQLIQETEGVPKRALPTTISTRWNIVFEQASEVLVQRDVLNKIVDTPTKFNTPDKITQTDVDLLNRLIRLLQPFEFVTKMLCRDDATCSQFIPALSVLLKKITTEAQNPMNASLKEDIEKMQKDCEGRLNKLLQNDFLVIASLMDPRYTIMIEDLTQKQFREYFHGIISLVTSFKDDELPEAQSTNEVARDSMLTNDDYNFWELTDQSMSNESQTRSSQQFEDKLEIELTIFRQKVSSDATSPNDNLRCWLLRNSVHFPTVVPLLYQLHCIPATSVTSERVFSKIGLILSNKLRNRLTPKKVRELLIVALNSAEEIDINDLLSDDTIVDELLLLDDEINDLEI